MFPTRPACWLALILALVLCRLAGGVQAAHWAHTCQLDPRIHLAWTPTHHHITFEVRARTKGFVAIGFSKDGTMHNADMAVAWVHQGQLVLQDRWSSGHSEPILDESQDYEPLLGYENGTHTVVRFRRRLDTCDPKDWRITNSTTRVIWAYSNLEPAHPGQALVYHGSEQRGFRSLFLVDGGADVSTAPTPPDLRAWELLHHQTGFSWSEADSVRWCKVFRMPNLKRKHHVIKFEPVLGSQGPEGPLRRAIVSECQGDPKELESHAHARGQECTHPRRYECTNVVVSWATGSQGLIYPPEAGYPLDPGRGPSYLMLEGHYSLPSTDITNSPGVVSTERTGIRLFYTATLRPYDAGTLSVGLESNWRHIIPPGQKQVVSQGHCIRQCTRDVIPPRGINIFAIAMHTNSIGTKIRLRHIQNGTEVMPIVDDDNYDPSYQEYRVLSPFRMVHPGDHLVSECAYNSEGRDSITLGGLSTRDETCLIDVLYYPKMSLSICHSLPSLPTVLRSLGIHELVSGSSPLRIKAPLELADTTLEARLVTYDWKNNFQAFQRATRRGSLKPICWSSRPAALLPGTEDLEVFPDPVSNSLSMDDVANLVPIVHKCDDDDLDNDGIDFVEDNVISFHESSPRMNRGAPPLHAAYFLVIIIFFFTHLSRSGQWTI